MLLKRFQLLLLISFLLLSGCSQSSHKNSFSPTDSTQTSPADLSVKSYANSQYNISLQRPDNWILLEESNLKAGDFAFNLFKRGTGAEKEIPLGVHVKPNHSYVAIWPHGLGTELPKSEYVVFDEAKNIPHFRFAVDKKQSKALKLKDGSTWAYFIVPKNPPKKWEPHGFIYAQIQVKNPVSQCYDEQTDQKLSMKECESLKGDRVVRQGNLNQQDTKTVQNILRSISLKKVEKSLSATDLIKIKKPLPNIDITSPLTIKGKAKGRWYFEGSFIVELFDANGNKLAEGQAKAQKKWMTDNFVPFSLTLTFDAPDDQRGRLVFHKANPSGKPENEIHYIQPILFPPK